VWAAPPRLHEDHAVLLADLARGQAIKLAQAALSGMRGSIHPECGISSALRSTCTQASLGSVSRCRAAPVPRQTPPRDAIRASASCWHDRGRGCPSRPLSKVATAVGRDSLDPRVRRPVAEPNMKDYQLLSSL